MRETSAPSLVIAGMPRRSRGWWRARPTSASQLILGQPRAQTLVLYIMLVGGWPWTAADRAADRGAHAPARAFGAGQASESRSSPAGPRMPPADHRAQRDGSAHRALLDEKDVMLGAIGHDLKTPLAALRVRIESVEDPVPNAPRWPTRSRTSPARSTTSSRLRGSDARPIRSNAPSWRRWSVRWSTNTRTWANRSRSRRAERIICRCATTWLRRALRNLASNAVRYAGSARVTLRRSR